MPGTVVVVIGGPVVPADVPGLCERLREVAKESEADSVTCDVGALTDPDAGTVDALARLALTARRLGRSIRLRHASCELQELLAFVGLCGVVGLDAALELRGQTEEGKEARGVEEEADPSDATG